jgi:hypothetical protein
VKLATLAALAATALVAALPVAAKWIPFSGEKAGSFLVGYGAEDRWLVVYDPGKHVTVSSVGLPFGGTFTPRITLHDGDHILLDEFVGTSVHATSGRVTMPAGGSTTNVLFVAVSAVPLQPVSKMPAPYLIWKE